MKAVNVRIETEKPKARRAAASFNKITGANAGGLRQLPNRALWAARIAQFSRWANSVIKPLQYLTATIVVLICLSFGGCSLATWARIYNRTDHAISLLQQNQGKMITVAPGSSAVVAMWDVTRGTQNGFLILDGSRELFYSLLPNNKANSTRSTTSLPLLPNECGKRQSNGLEYGFEYAADSELFALSPVEQTNPKRVDPQPAGFPLKPNKPMQPTPR
jgi:hypothetical protein